jgi:hypothetical protein
MIRFACPKCGKLLKAETEHAGKLAKCARCGISLPVPAKPRSSLLARSSRKPLLWTVGWSVGGGLVLIVGVVLLVICLQPAGVDQKLRDLKSSDPATSKQALDWLAQASPRDSQRPLVTAALEPLLFDGDVHKQLNPDLVLRVYLTWADRDNVPAMIRMVETPTLADWSARKAGMVMEALGKLQDVRACSALAARLSDSRLHDQAVNALEVMGPGGQEAVLEYLFDPDLDTRLRAAKLLADYHTKPTVIAVEARQRLQASQADVQRSAVVWFVDHPPQDEGEKAAVSQQFARLLADLSPEVTSQVLQALKSWGTRDCLPQLLTFARREQKNPAGNPLLIDVLVQFQEDAAAEAIALQLLNRQTRGKVVQALLTPTLRPVAEKAVLPYLDHPDVEVRKAARDLCSRLDVSPDRQLEQTLADITDPKRGRSITALEHLARLRPDEANRAKVSRAIDASLLDQNVAIRESALDAVKVWGTSENTGNLLQMLGNVQAGGAGRDTRIIDALGVIKDPRAAAVLAQGLTHGRERGPVSKALQSIGPAAEEAVLPFLQVEDREARCAACRLLAEIGTDKSLRPLKDAGLKYGFGDDGFFKETQLAEQKILARK